MSIYREGYASASEWLEAFKQDDMWQRQLRNLETTDDINRWRKDAMSFIGNGTTAKLWKIYKPDVESVVNQIWTIPMTLPMLKVQTVGMLSIVWLEQHKQVNEPNGNGIQLPKDLDTPKARKYFALAIEKQYMTIDNGKYRWIGTCKITNNSELSYFLGKIYNYVHTDNGNAGMSFPQESLNNLFGVKRLYQSLTQVYNAKKKQPWRSRIDAMFEQG